MGRVHAMPPDTNEKEKIVGGILDSSQLITLIIGAGIGAILTFATFKALKGFALLLFLPPFIASFPFAFKKVEDLSYPKYLLLNFLYKRKIKNYINKGTHTELLFDGEEDLDAY